MTFGEIMVEMQQIEQNHWKWLSVKDFYTLSIVECI